MIDIKWFMLGFIVSIAASWLVGEIVLRKLKRKNRRLRLALDVQCADEAARRLSAFQIDLDRREAAMSDHTDSERQQQKQKAGPEPKPLPAEEWEEAIHSVMQRHGITRDEAIELLD